jgi:hypothetical protein
VRFGIIIDHPLVIDGNEVTGEALGIIAALMDELDASVALHDRSRREAHIKMTGAWWCAATAPDEIPIGMRDPDGEELSARINRRWRLWVAPDTHFPPDARDVIKEAAKKLAAFLPGDAVNIGDP